MNEKSIEIAKQIQKLLNENDCGELYITWKGNSIQMKFSKYIKVSILTIPPKSD